MNSLYCNLRLGKTIARYLLGTETITICMIFKTLKIRIQHLLFDFKYYRNPWLRDLKLEH